MDLSVEEFTYHNIAKIVQSKHHFRCHSIKHMSFEIYDANAQEFKIVSGEYVQEVIKRTINEVFPHKTCTLNRVNCVLNELAKLAYVPSNF